MATITSAQAGLHSAASTWVGGVVPGLGDKAIIDHLVDYSGNWSVGDDTSTGLRIRAGRLRASRTVSSQLTVRGDLYVDPITGGVLDLGTEADPIPAGVLAQIVLNNSAVMATSKWGLRTNEASGAWTGGISIWGAAKKADTLLSAAVGATDTVVGVLDATGWQVGDMLGFSPPSGNGVLYRQITAINPGAGTAALITIGASLGRSGSAGNGVLNVTRNVRIIGDTPQTYRTHVAIRANPSAVGVVAGIEIGPCTIVAGGAAANNWMTAGLVFYYENPNNAFRVIRKIDGPVITSLVSVVGAAETHVNGVRNGLSFFNLQAASAFVKAAYAAVPSNSGNAIQVFAGSSVEFGSDCVLLGGLNAIATQFSQGAVSSAYRGRIWGCSNVIFGVCISFDLIGAIIGPNTRLTSLSAAGRVNFIDVTMDGSEGDTSSPGNMFLHAAGWTFPTIISNPKVSASFGLARSSSISAANSSHSVTVLQKNGDPAANERFTPGGRVHRDGTRTRRSTGSICLASWFYQNVLSMPLSAKVQPGEALRIKGAVWIEAAYLPGDAPAIALSGTGLTTVNWSAPTVADAWHEFDLQIVNTNSYPTDVAITLTARSNANTETARVWCDGLFSDPWSGSVRHHGFQWLAQTALVADTRITLTEAAALALPVAVNHTTQTITVTGAVNARQVFEAAMADLAQTANQARAVHITSATGDSFETTYAVATSGAGVITGAYQDAAGRHVTISAPALIAGSRVQLYDLTTATELYNGVLTGAGLLVPATWAADHTIRLRAEHADKLALQAVGVLSSSGLTYLDVQADDTVYLGNSIDGAGCTEFAADGANVQVDISDPDGVTSVQRLYAWAQWYQTTAAGIASQLFGAVQAIDSATYVIDQALADIHLDNVQATPVRVVGGYLARKDGSTVIATGSGSIQMDPGKAYVAGVDGLARESTAQTILALSLG